MKYLYEKDLRRMKYTILTSTRHDETVHAIARRLGTSDGKLRVAVLRRFDMSLLENLESRWQMGLEHADRDDPVAKDLGYELFTRFIPLVDPDVMRSIYDETTAMIGNDGTSRDEALERGRARVREAVIS